MYKEKYEMIVIYKHSIEVRWSADDFVHVELFVNLLT